MTEGHIGGQGVLEAEHEGQRRPAQETAMRHLKAKLARLKKGITSLMGVCRTLDE